MQRSGRTGCGGQPSAARGHVLDRHPRLVRRILVAAPFLTHFRLRRCGRGLLAGSRGNLPRRRSWRRLLLRRRHLLLRLRVGNQRINRQPLPEHLGVARGNVHTPHGGIVGVHDGAIWHGDVRHRLAEVWNCEKRPASLMDNCRKRPPSAENFSISFLCDQVFSTSRSTCDQVLAPTSVLFKGA